MFPRHILIRAVAVHSTVARIKAHNYEILLLPAVLVCECSLLYTIPDLYSNPYES